MKKMRLMAAVKPGYWLSNSEGFTLTETLVSLGILVMILVVTVSTFLTVMTKQTKVKVVKAVESDGKYAMRTMRFMIRNSRDVLPNTSGEVCESSMQSIKLKNPDNGETEFFCASDHVASSSAFPDGSTEYHELTSSETTLLSCSISCSPGGFNKPDTVEINFSLGQAESSERVEEQASLDFHSTVTTRNY